MVAAAGARVDVDDDNLFLTDFGMAPDLSYLSVLAVAPNNLCRVQMENTRAVVTRWMDRRSHSDNVIRGARVCD